MSAVPVVYFAIVLSIVPMAAAMPLAVFFFVSMAAIVIVAPIVRAIVIAAVMFVFVVTVAVALGCGDSCRERECQQPRHDNPEEELEWHESLLLVGRTSIQNRSHEQQITGG